MREILFRGKNKEGRWFYGDLLSPNIIITDWDKDCVDRQFGADYGVVEPETIGQYTGLKDRNGAKIFEGDIVRYSGWFDNIYKNERNTFGIVKIGPYDQDGSGDEYGPTPCQGVYVEMASFKKSEDWDEDDEYPECRRTFSLRDEPNNNGFEVVGNTYDNPELLQMEADDHA